MYIRKMLGKQQNNNKVSNVSMITELKTHRTLKLFMQEGNSEIIQVSSFCCQGKQDSKKPDHLYNIHSLPVVEMKGKLLSSDLWYNSHIKILQTYKEAVLDFRYPFQEISSETMFSIKIYLSPLAFPKITIKQESHIFTNLLSFYFS